jgi:hypothetical protein
VTLAAQEVPVVEGEVVLAIRALADCGVGSKAIALSHSSRFQEPFSHLL